MIVAIIQARMGSSRLPGKVLAPLGGQPLLAVMLKRVRRARKVDKTVVATSVDPRDDAIATLCRDLGVPCYRGDEMDVLARYHGAALEQHADSVVRLTADCPFIDAGVIDNVIDLSMTAPRVAYASNVDPPTFPDGLDVEVITAEALEAAHLRAQRPVEREHVTIWIRERPVEFPAMTLRAPADFSHLRWTVDYADDLEFAHEVVRRLADPDFTFSWFDILALLTRMPELIAINAGHRRNEALLAAQRSDGAA